jgi:hypothetical protein
VAHSQNPAQPELTSTILRASILAKIPPVPLAPESDAVVTVNKGDPTVKFLWSNPAGFAKVIVEIASSPDLKQKIKTEYLENVTEYDFVADKSTTIYWRVTGVLEGRKEVVTSQVQKFKLNLLNELSPPELEAPRANEKVPVDTIKDHGLNLSWKATPGAERYRIIVEKAGPSADNRKPSASDKVFEDEGKVLQVSLKDLKPGNYTWAVASIGAKNETSKFAEKRLFAVQTLPIFQWADGKIKEDFYYISLKPSVTLKWEKGDAKATSWSVRLSHADNNINPIVQKVNTNGADLTLPQDGPYVAEVEAFDDRGNLLARSVKREVKVVPAPLLPAPEFASTTPSEIEASGGGSANLQWKEVKGAEKYVLVIKTPDGKNPKEYNFSALEGSLKGLMPGQYKVSLRSIDQHGRVGQEGEERVLKVPSQSNVRAPKLKGMKVK